MTVGNPQGSGLKDLNHGTYGSGCDYRTIYSGRRTNIGRRDSPIYPNESSKERVPTSYDPPLKKLAADFNFDRYFFSSAFFIGHQGRRGRRRTASRTETGERVFAG